MSSDMRVVRETVGRIEIHTDHSGRIVMECMPMEEPELSLAEKIVNELYSFVSVGCCVSMVIVLARIVGLI